MRNQFQIQSEERPGAAIPLPQPLLHPHELLLLLRARGSWFRTGDRGGWGETCRSLTANHICPGIQLWECIQCFQNKKSYTREHCSLPTWPKERSHTQALTDAPLRLWAHLFSVSASAASSRPPTSPPSLISSPKYPPGEPCGARRPLQFLMPTEPHHCLGSSACGRAGEAARHGRAPQTAQGCRRQSARHRHGFATGAGSKNYLFPGIFPVSETSKQQVMLSKTFVTSEGKRAGTRRLSGLTAARQVTHRQRGWGEMGFCSCVRFLGHLHTAQPEEK